MPYLYVKQQVKDFDVWYKSDDYQKILQYRLKAADCGTILIRGLSS
ncbi:MAG: DUF1330 domain-containing protein [Bacteroidales bacterium]|nr:DUF1330 domain-containing protein [Bacteroidales bacterium]